MSLFVKSILILDVRHTQYLLQYHHYGSLLLLQSCAVSCLYKVYYCSEKLGFFHFSNSCLFVSTILLPVTQKLTSVCHVGGCLNSQNASEGQRTEEACQKSYNWGCTGVSLAEVFLPSKYKTGEADWNIHIMARLFIHMLLQLLKTPPHTDLETVLQPPWEPHTLPTSSNRSMIKFNS